MLGEGVEEGAGTGQRWGCASGCFCHRPLASLVLRHLPQPRPRLCHIPLCSHRTAGRGRGMAFHCSRQAVQDAG